MPPPPPPPGSGGVGGGGGTVVDGAVVSVGAVVGGPGAVVLTPGAVVVVEPSGSEVDVVGATSGLPFLPSKIGAANEPSGTPLVTAAMVLRQIVAGNVPP